MSNYISCCFIGHRFIQNKKINQPLRTLILDLIENIKVTEFYFGTKSEFNDLCYDLVSELKQEFKDIKRICITCKSECVVLANDKDRMQEIYNKFLNGRKVCEFEEEIKFDNVLSAGKLSYIKRNEEMINLSDYCVFYLDELYINSNFKSSGTKIAYDYTKRKNKNIILIK